MRKIKLGGKAVEIYDSIEELPITRFHAYNKMLLVDAGIGSDLSDIDNHISRTVGFMQDGRADIAERELDNLRQCIYFAQSEISPRCMAFAALVKSIDGVEYNGVGTDSLKEVVEKLGGSKVGELFENFLTVKKKIDEELTLYFPREFEDAKSKEYFDKLRQKALLTLDAVISDEEDDSKLKAITREVLTYFKPQVFEGTESVEVQHDKQFDKMCIALSKSLHIHPKTLTTLEFYNAFEYLKEQIKADEKALKRK